MEGQQAGGEADVVGAGVRHDVTEVDAQPDLGRLVADGLHAGQRRLPGFDVSAVTPDVGRRPVEVGGRATMGGGVEGVEHDHFVALLDEQVDDV